jgi:hypothetical protein
MIPGPFSISGCANSKRNRISWWLSVLGWVGLTLKSKLALGPLQDKAEGGGGQDEDRLGELTWVCAGWVLERAAMRNDLGAK